MSIVFQTIIRILKHVTSRDIRPLPDILGRIFGVGKGTPTLCWCVMSLLVKIWK